MSDGVCRATPQRVRHFCLGYIRVLKKRPQSFVRLLTSKSCHIRYTCSPQRQQRLRSDDVQRDSRNGEGQTSRDLVYLRGTDYPCEYVTARAAKFMLEYISERDSRQIDAKFDTPVPRNGSDVFEVAAGVQRECRRSFNGIYYQSLIQSTTIIEIY